MDREREIKLFILPILRSLAYQLGEILTVESHLVDQMNPVSVNPGAKQRERKRTIALVFFSYKWSFDMEIQEIAHTLPECMSICSCMPKRRAVACLVIPKVVDGSRPHPLHIFTLKCASMCIIFFSISFFCFNFFKYM